MCETDEIGIDCLLEILNRLTFDEPEEPLLIKKNPEILSELLKNVNGEIDLWNTCTIEFTGLLFKLIELEQDTSEYRSIKSFFDSTMRRPYSVDKIERVENPYLRIQYQLMKCKKACSTEILFHGTTHNSIESICKQNFNWRLAGSRVGHIFGRGVSFSPESTYSSHYPRNYTRSERVMFVADVLIKNCCYGGKDMIIPTGNCDTSIKHDRKVIVKYEDNAFYPKYVIYYS